jgi:2-iminobutanoate/2-iminopropanoate deaminase
MHAIHDIGIAKQIGLYSDALEVAPDRRWLMTSGTPGLSATGACPGNISDQAELAWSHIRQMLTAAEMTTDDIVKVTQYLIRPDDIAPYAQVRSRFLGNARPASMLLVVPQLVRPEFLVEVEIIAAK